MPSETQYALSVHDIWTEMQPLHAETGHTDQASVTSYDHEDGPGILQNEAQTDRALNRRTLLKLDYILLPFVSILFCLNSLDKTNIGNAETAGFSHDAGLDQSDINMAMAYFFAFFVALQPVGAALGRRVGMARWVPACMSLWGLCTILHIWVRSRWQLVLLRIVIATLEAGFYPTTVSYLSLFYTRYEFAVRLGVFYGQAAVSGALGGVLSWAVFSRFSKAPSLRERETIHPWQVLFLVEGCLTLVVALIGFLWLPHSAGSAWFFNDAERKWAESGIALDRDNAMSRTVVTAKPNREEDDSYDEAHEHLLGDSTGSAVKHDAVDSQTLTTDSGLHRHEIVAAFLQWKIWLLLACNILSAIPATAFGIFLPIVIKQMSPDLNISPAASNLLAVPPFAFGAIVLLAFTYWSDRTQRRLVPILAGLIILMLGLLITVWIPTSNLPIRYVGLCILLSGSYIASPLTVAWLSNNTPEPGKRAVLLGINGWGNLAGISTAFLFTPDDAKSGYAGSFAATLICVAISFIGYSFFMLAIRQENMARTTLTAAWSDAQRAREASYGDVEARPPSSFLSRVATAIGAGSVRRGDNRLTYRYSF